MRNSSLMLIFRLLCSGPDSQYPGMNWAFLIGLVLPVPFWLLHKRFPNSKIPWHLVNVPVRVYTITM